LSRKIAQERKMKISDLISKTNENTKTPQNTTQEQAPLDNYRDALNLSNSNWYDILPLDDRNDPLYGISPQIRAKLIEELHKTTPEKQPNPKDYDYSLALKKYPDLAKKQREAIKIALRGMPPFPRGTRGHTLDAKALLPFDQNKIKKLLRALENGATLCHLNGWICTLQSHAYRVITG
jgi:hypothetical protein